MKRFGLGEDGSGLVELAFVLPVLLFLAMGIWEFGRVLDAQVVVNNAAREGVRYASLGHPADEVQQRVLRYVQEGLGSRVAAKGDVKFKSSDIVVTNAAGTIGQPVSVTVPVQVQILVPAFWSQLGLSGSAITLSGAATMLLQCGGPGSC